MEEENHEEVVKSFEELGVCEPLIEACTKLGWITPTQIQAQAIPHALQGKDIIGLAETGSGKTGAFVLPIIQALLEADSPKPLFGCVLSPTRELAIQIADQFGALGASIGLKTTALVGGIDINQQQFALGKRPHIIVATPGRLMDHLSNTKGFSLRTLKYLVLDEADRLLDGDFEKELDDILKVIPLKRRTFLYSATMTNKVKKLQRACLRNPVKIAADSKYSIAKTLKQQYLFIPEKFKISGSAMVFTQSCESASWLALMLRNLGFRAVSISGKMSQPKRLGAFNKFKSGDCNILVCTDVASRGWDIASVDLVINYHIPGSFKDYKHRVGRTARAQRSGLAISLVTQYQIDRFLCIDKLVGKKMLKRPAEEEEVLLLMERVNEAKRIANMNNKESGKTKVKKCMEDEEEEIKMYLNKGTKFSRSRQPLKNSRPLGVKFGKAFKKSRR